MRDTARTAIYRVVFGCRPEQVATGAYLRSQPSVPINVTMLDLAVFDNGRRLGVRGDGG